MLKKGLDPLDNSLIVWSMGYAAALAGFDEIGEEWNKSLSKTALQEPCTPDVKNNRETIYYFLPIQLLIHKWDLGKAENARQIETQIDEKFLEMTTKCIPFKNIGINVLMLHYMERQEYSIVERLFFAAEASEAYIVQEPDGVKNRINIPDSTEIPNDTPIRINLTSKLHQSAYATMISCYMKWDKPESAKKVMQMMIDKGISIDSHFVKNYLRNYLVPSGNFSECVEFAYTYLSENGPYMYRIDNVVRSHLLKSLHISHINGQLNNIDGKLIINDKEIDTSSNSILLQCIDKIMSNSSGTNHRLNRQVLCILQDNIVVFESLYHKWMGRGVHYVPVYVDYGVISVFIKSYLRKIRMSISLREGWYIYEERLVDGELVDMEMVMIDKVVYLISVIKKKGFRFDESLSKLEGFEGDRYDLVRLT